MPKTNKTKYALMGMLLHRPMSGYDIKRFSDFSISHFWSENYGHIYPILKRLEAESLAKSLVRRRAGKPDRHVYAITEKGREEFLEWLKKPAEAETRRNEFLLKLFFASVLPLQDVVRLIEFEKDRYARVIKTYDQIGQGDMKKIYEKGTIRFDRLTLSYGKKLASARYGWCEEVIQELKRRTQCLRDARKNRRLTKSKNDKSKDKKNCHLRE